MRNLLVDHVQAALCRLADAPSATEAARAATAQVEQAWARRPHVVAIDGSVEARVELVNYLFGGRLLEPVEHVPLRVRRGATTRYEVRHKDGTSSRLPLPQPRAETHDMALLRVELFEREATLQQIEVEATRLSQVRPPWWKPWLWPLAWWRGWRMRAHRRRVETTVELSRAELAGLRDQQRATTADGAPLERAEPIATFRAWCARADVAEIVIELSGGPLPEDVEVREVRHPIASAPGEPADAMLVTTRDRIHAPGHPSLGLGTIAEVIDVLPTFLAGARALALAHRFGGKITSAFASLESALNRKRDAFQARIDRLEGLRIDDTARYCEAELARLDGELDVLASSALARALEVLTEELAQLEIGWLGAFDRAGTRKELAAAVADVERMASERFRRIATRVQTLAHAELAAGVPRLHDDLLAALVERGLPDRLARPHVTTPVPEAPLVPSLAGAQAISLADKSGVLGWFRTLARRRVTVRDAVGAWLGQVRERAGAELQGSAPAVCTAVRGVLSQLLDDVLERHAAWLDDALATEHAEIATERAAIAPLARLHEAARRDLRALAEEIADVERSQPALAAAAFANASPTLTV